MSELKDSTLERVFVVDKTPETAEIVRNWLDDGLNTLRAMNVDIVTAKSLREIISQVGECRDEMIVLGQAGKIATRRVRRPGGTERFPLPSLDVTLRGYCVATLGPMKGTFDGQLDGPFLKYAEQLLDVYRNRRPRVLVVDNDPLAQAGADMQRVGLNPIVLDIHRSNTVFRKRKYRSFDLILATQDVDPSTLRIISNEGAPPIFLYTDVPPSDVYGLDEARDKVKERLEENYSHCDNVVGAICPRADYHLLAQVAQHLVETGSIGLPDEELDIDLSRGGTLKPTQVIERKGPNQGAKLVYSSRM